MPQGHGGREKAKKQKEKITRRRRGPEIRGADGKNSEFKTLPEAGVPYDSKKGRGNAAPLQRRLRQITG
jgi:hypothetical protein